MKNTFEVVGDVAIIYVPHKGETLTMKVDLSTLTFLLENKRAVSARLCGSRIYFTSRVNGKNQYVHRIVTDYPNGLVVDHINQDTSDNRRSNLRVVTKSENMMNQSNTRGVDFREDMGKWRSRIFVKGKEVLLGNFKTYDEALVARLRAEREYFPNIVEGRIEDAA